MTSIPAGFTFGAEESKQMKEIEVKGQTALFAGWKWQMEFHEIVDQTCAQRPEHKHRRLPRYVRRQRQLHVSHACLLTLSRFQSL